MLQTIPSKVSTGELGSMFHEVTLKDEDAKRDSGAVSFEFIYIGRRLLCTAYGISL